MKIIVGISGATGSHLGIKLANHLAKEHDISVIISAGAKNAFIKENMGMYLENSDPAGRKQNSSSENSALNFSENSSSENSKSIESFLAENIKVYDDISAAPASGSALFESMIIAPCSINSLAKIASGISDNLLLRAAAVMLKERRKLVLAVRETPLSPISLEQMANLAKIGVMIAPPVLGYYSKPKSLNELESYIIGKWCDMLGVKNNLFKRWENE